MTGVACIGMSTLDTVLRNDRFRYMPEHVNVVTSCTESLGGKGLVAALALIYRQVPTRLVSLVGRDSAIPAACGHRISPESLLPTLDQDSRTWLMIDDAQQVVTCVAVGRRTSALSEVHRAIIADVIDAADVVYLSTEDNEVLDVSITHLRATDTLLATNLCMPLINMLHSAARVSALLQRTKILLLNERESAIALKMLGVPTWGDLRGTRLSEIVITGGSAGGSYAQYPFASWQTYSAVPVELVGCVAGAGDTFNGAYLAARAWQRLPMADSCWAAAQLSAVKVSQHGTGLAW